MHRGLARILGPHERLSVWATMVHAFCPPLYINAKFIKIFHDLLMIHLSQKCQPVGLNTRRCVLGLTCNKPMWVWFPISFRSHEHIWTWRVDISTGRLRSPLRQMHDHMNCDAAAHWCALTRPRCGHTKLFYAVLVNYGLVFIVCMCPPVNIHCHGQ